MKCNLALLYLLISFCASGQVEAFTHGGTDDDIGYCFAPNGLGGYVLLGTERTSENSSEDFSWVNIDEKGNVIWKRNWGSLRSDIPEHIEQTKDGGYIIAGSRYDGGFLSFDGFISKINSEGEITWLKYIGGSGREEIFSVKQTSDGGYIACGFTTSDTIFSFGQMYIVKTDPLGNEEWHAYAGGPGKDYSFDIIETADGSFLAVGTYSGFHRYSTFEFTDTHSDLLISKISASGEIIWENQYGGNENELGRQIKQGPNGNFYVIGSTQSAGFGSFDMYLLKIDPNGNELWSKNYGNIGFDYGSSLDIDPSGAIYIAGTTNTDTLTFKTDIAVLKTDLQGNEIWSLTLGGSASDYGNFIRSTPDGGCAIIGNSKSFGMGGDDIFFIKLSSNGLIEPLLGSNESSMLVYPNPAVDQLNFYLQEGNDCLDYLYEIYDGVGNLIYSKTNATKLVTLDVTEFAQGRYIYRVSSPCLNELRGSFIVH
jgi:hypothetical protein